METCLGKGNGGQQEQWVELTFKGALAHAYRDRHSHAVLPRMRIDYIMMYGHRALG